MGKRIFQRRAGKGSSVFKSPTWKCVGPARYPRLDGLVEGRITQLVHDPGRGVPLVRVTYDGGEFLTVAAEGSFIGETIQIGKGASPVNANIMPLSDVPDGSKVFNVESRKGDGGTLARTSGAYCTLVSHTENKVIVVLPSGVSKSLDPSCRATLGTAAAGGRTEKPFLKAGAKYHLMKVKPTKYPKVRGVAMNIVSHPHGGGNHPSVSRSTTVSRRMSPGRKVGHIAARRAGRR